METQARFVVVGAFTLLGMLALLGFLLWLGQVQINRAYAQYDIVFDTVSGLSQDSLVRYNGVDVGSVLDIALDTRNPALVRVRIEVNATTPVRADTVATLSSQGVTGVSFVALEGGSPNSLPLVAIPPAEVPVIASEPSIVQELTDAAPNLLREALALIEDVRRFTTPENTAAVADILQNVEKATDRIDEVVTRAETVIARADAALTEAEGAFAGARTVIDDDLPGLIDALQATVADVGEAAAELRNFASTGLPQYTILAAEAQNTLDTIRSLVDRIGRDPSRFFLGNQTPSYRN